MVNLSWLLQTLFELHGMIPQKLRADGHAFQPIHMLMEVTYRCNLRCNFCQYLDIIEGKAQPVGPSPGDLPLADILRCIDELPSGRLITFAGGETLVRRDFPEILTHASRRHRTHIITNGALITEAVARSYVDLAPRRMWQNGLVLVEVSLQGDEALHDRIVQRKGSWRRAVEGIQHLVRARHQARTRFPKYDLKLVVTKDSVAAMVQFMHLAKSLGVDLINFLAEHDLVGNAAGGELSHLSRPQRRPQGVDPDFLRAQLIRCYELERELGVQIRLTPFVPIDEFVRHYSDDRSLDPSEYVCDGPWSRLAVAADGRYAPMCHYAAGGDMRRQSIREAWNGERFRAFRRATQAARVHPGCNGCCNLRYVGSQRLGLAGASATHAPAPAPQPYTSDHATVLPLARR
jgi:MoaA/NifB/PqqE/SkfB family radical SAM enzyme